MSDEVVGFPEFEDELSQYARQRRPRTVAEAAEVERLLQSRSKPEFLSEVDRVAKRSGTNTIVSEVERLARLHDEKSVNLPTSAGARTSNDDPRIQRARQRIRDGA